LLIPARDEAFRREIIHDGIHTVISGVTKRAAWCTLGFDQ
jgi:hypothetical protein